MTTESFCHEHGTENTCHLQRDVGFHEDKPFAGSCSCFCFQTLMMIVAELEIPPVDWRECQCQLTSSSSICASWRRESHSILAFVALPLWVVENYVLRKNSCLWLWFRRREGAHTNRRSFEDSMAWYGSTEGSTTRLDIHMMESESLPMMMMLMIHLWLRHFQIVSESSKPLWICLAGHRQLLWWSSIFEILIGEGRRRKISTAFLRGSCSVSISDHLRLPRGWTSKFWKKDVTVSVLGAARLSICGSPL